MTTSNEELAKLLRGVDLEKLKGLLGAAQGPEPKLNDGTIIRLSGVKVKRRFTIYDRMEFPRYTYKPWPKLVYHPEGKRSRANGPMISMTVYNEDQMEKLLAEGWHDHPAKAAEAAGSGIEARTLMGTGSLNKELKRENESLKDTVEQLTQQMQELMALVKKPSQVASAA